MKHPEVTLRADDEADVKRAAIFVATLVTQGIQFTGRGDIVRHPSGQASEPGLVLTLTGY